MSPSTLRDLRLPGALLAALGAILLDPHVARAEELDPRQDQRRVLTAAARPGMETFGSDAELLAFLRQLGSAQKADQARVTEHYRRLAHERRRARLRHGGGLLAPSAKPGDSAGPTTASRSSGTTAGHGRGSGAEESVTNNQHAGVDEGGIVKVHGRHLVVLRRGRLFTVRIGAAASPELRPISAVDAFGPDIDPRGAWYDEMLVSGNTVVVIGYSYQRGGTEVGLFDIDDGGNLRYRATYHLRANDYYSSRNYASRLLGSKLVFYSPLYLRLGQTDVTAALPALRRWRRGALPTEFNRITSSARTYRPIAPFDSLALHTVTVCDLARREMSCEATVVMGPAGRVFYVSSTAVYVWMTDHAGWRGPVTPRKAFLYRMPLEGQAPSVVPVSGSPIDQFSFLEEPDGHLNVLVRAGGRGEAMWAGEVQVGALALLRLPPGAFAREVRELPSWRYRGLPRPEGYTVHNRFVGSYLLYGAGTGWGRARATSGTLYATRYASGEGATALPMPHTIDRIEPLAEDALVVGTSGTDLHVTSLALGPTPVVASSHVERNASQGELRSHGFFYKPDPATPRGGLLGLPIRGANRPGYSHLVRGSAGILFMRVDALRLQEIGVLGARGGPTTARADGCKASCVDWYGNARPLFVRGRVLALLGYELVEGELGTHRAGVPLIRERGRINFAPAPLVLAR